MPLPHRTALLILTALALALTPSAQAGNLVDLALHPVWLERAHPNNISRLIVVAIDDARRNLGATLPQVVADSRMTRLAGELNDPDALAARLGL